MLFKAKNSKKGVSEVVGYVLLIGLVVIMGAIAYAWLKSYIPQETPQCPDGISLMAEEWNYNSTNKLLTINLKNNGLFDVDGIYIKAATKLGQEVATTDLSGYYNKNKITGADFILLKILPSYEKAVGFNLGTSNLNHIYFIEITPIAIQKEGKKGIVQCGNAKIREEINKEID
ncbi:MAG: hypothetical protein KKA64_04435 [Nanoarchaeota archaeon]|nr:hypothetical protein [Nanoarchaeota archaeon]